MFKTFYGLIGALQADLTDFAVNMTVDDVMFGRLRKCLGATDYTYLIIKTDAIYEIVKVTGFVGNTVAITRAQDGTTAQAFAMGVDVEFVMGDQAIADMINDRMLGQIDITGSGIVQVTRTGTNSFSVYAPPLSIVSNSSKILVGGEFPNIVLSAPLASGCCD